MQKVQVWALHAHVGRRAVGCFDCKLGRDPSREAEPGLSSAQKAVAAAVCRLGGLLTAEPGCGQHSAGRVQLTLQSSLSPGALAAAAGPGLPGALSWFPYQREQHALQDKRASKQHSSIRLTMKRTSWPD
jgi:hypothetical protein